MRGRKGSSVNRQGSVGAQSQRHANVCKRYWPAVAFALICMQFVIAICARMQGFNAFQGVSMLIRDEVMFDMQFAVCKYRFCLCMN